MEIDKGERRGRGRFRAHSSHSLCQEDLDRRTVFAMTEKRLSLFKPPSFFARSLGISLDPLPLSFPLLGPFFLFRFLLSLSRFLSRSPESLAENKVWRCQLVFRFRTDRIARKGKRETGISTTSQPVRKFYMTFRSHDKTRKVTRPQNFQNLKLTHML